MEGNRINIENLEGVSESCNWVAWKFHLRQILEDSELFDLVDGTEDKPKVAEGDYVTKIAIWKKKDSKCKRIFSAACTRQAVMQIMTCVTATSVVNV